MVARQRAWNKWRTCTACVGATALHAGSARKKPCKSLIELATFSNSGWKGCTHDARRCASARVGDENELAAFADGRRGGRLERAAPAPPVTSPLSADAASAAAAPSEDERACDMLGG